MRPSLGLTLSSCLPQRRFSRLLSADFLDACIRAEEGKALALLGQGASPSLRGTSGSTSLMFAARHDLPTLFLALCDHADGPALAQARDSRGRDALFWASARTPFCKRGHKPPSHLFELIDEQLFDLSNLDLDGRHACQMAFQSLDDQACLFWFARAPSAIVDDLIDSMDAWQRHIGLHARASTLRSLSERMVYTNECAKTHKPMGQGQGSPRL